MLSKIGIILGTIAPGDIVTVDADGSLVDGGAVPAAPTLAYPVSLSWEAGQDPTSQTIFIADRARTILSVKAVIEQGNANTAAFYVAQVPNGQLVTGSSNQCSTEFYVATQSVDSRAPAPGTVVDLTLSGPGATLVAGDRLVMSGAPSNGAMTTSRACITVTVQ